MARQIPWTHDEVTLACDLVRQNGWWELRTSDPRVRELSELLQLPWAHPLHDRPVNFRSPGSVSRKTADLFTALPHYGGRATKGGRADRAVLDRFLDDPDGLVRRAAEIRQYIADKCDGAERHAALVSTERARARSDHRAARPTPVDVVAIPTVGAAESSLADHVVNSLVFQRQLTRAGRHAPGVDIVHRTVALLLTLGGRASLAQIAAGTELPLAPLSSSTATVLKRVLNVDGYPVLDVTDGFYRLDRHLLEEQFEIGIESPHRR